VAEFTVVIVLLLVLVLGIPSKHTLRRNKNKESVTGRILTPPPKMGVALSERGSVTRSNVASQYAYEFNGSILQIVRCGGSQSRAPGQCMDTPGCHAITFASLFSLPCGFRHARLDVLIFSL
jgi:hypothetical protein